MRTLALIHPTRPVVLDMRTFLRMCRPGVERQRMTLEAADLMRMATQIAAGMAYVESLAIVHRNLAAKHIMVNNAGTQCKITEFGLSRDTYVSEVYISRSTEGLPLAWMAPETLKDNISRYGPRFPWATKSCV